MISPANQAYLDMKYNKQTPLGLSWAGYVEIKDSYDWDPRTLIDGIKESDIAGVEAPLWSETLVKIADIEFMAFPRLPGIAELGWSPAAAHNWDAYRVRLGAQVRSMDRGRDRLYGLRRSRGRRPDTVEEAVEKAVPRPRGTAFDLAGRHEAAYFACGFTPGARSRAIGRYVGHGRSPPMMVLAAAFLAASNI